MTESLRIGYVRLFEVRVLHHFWLDEGATVFNQIADPARTQRLLSYDVTRLLSFQPSPATAVAIAGLRGVFRTTALGFLVAVPDDTAIPLDAAFEFFVTRSGIGAGAEYAACTAGAFTRPGVTGPTTPALSPQPVVSVLDPVADPATGVRRVHRYKANVPVLSNLTGVTRVEGAATRLYLSREYPAATPDDAVEALVSVGSDLCQRAGEPPAASLTVIGATASLPVFVHQGDVPPITPPAGAAGAPAFGIELDDAAPPGLTALIRLVPRRLGNSPFNFAELDGTPSPRVFEVHLQNRRTTWRYLRKSDGALTATEASPLPLTHFGNAGTKQKPSNRAVGAEFDNQDPPRITRLVSDIYV